MFILSLEIGRSLSGARCPGPAAAFETGECDGMKNSGMSAAPRSLDLGATAGRAGLPSSLVDAVRVRSRLWRGAPLKKENSMEELPQYLCHKKVSALKIASITRDEDDSKSWLLQSEGPYEDRVVTAEYIAKHSPTIGGYWVQYEDGYQSFSPAEAFEKGYTLIEHA